MLRLEGEVLGPAARRVLSSRRKGVVLSSHRKGFYCYLDGEVLLVQEVVEEVTPFGIALADLGPLAGMPAGSPLQCCAEILLFPDLGITVDCTDTPTPQSMDFPLDINRLSVRLDSLVQSAATFGTGSATPLACQLPALCAGEALPGNITDVWAQALWNPLRNMAAYCRQDTQIPVQRIVYDILGLGPGLTPLGDDIVCGVMAAACAFERPFPSLRPVREELSLAILELCGYRTTPQSAAFLKSAAQGEPFILLRHVMRQLFSQRRALPAADRIPSLRRLLGVGHSSGAGFLLGILMVAWQTMNNPGQHRQSLPTR